MSDAFDYSAFLEKAIHHLNALTSAHQGAWKLGEAESWTADQETGLLTWTFEDGRIAEAPFQIVGTFDSLDSTFLWGWDHPCVLPDLQHDAQQVLAWAREQEIKPLLEQKVTCAEEDAWEYAALATLICDRQGAYRGPAGTTYVFMTFGEVKLSQPEG